MKIVRGVRATFALNLGFYIFCYTVYFVDSWCKLAVVSY